METAIRNDHPEIDSIEALRQDNDSHLQQIAELVQRMSPADFRATSGVDDAIGTHIRHLLEHYESLFAAADGFVDYDRRERDRTVERCPDTALRRLEAIRATLERLTGQQAPVPIAVTYTHERPAGTPTLELDSSLERELLFLVSHTVHHMALISVLARQRQIEVPPHFGVAASTLRHRA